MVTMEKKIEEFNERLNQLGLEMEKVNYNNGYKLDNTKLEKNIL